MGLPNTGSSAYTSNSNRTIGGREQNLCRRSSLFHSFYESEHLIRSFILFFGRCVWVNIVFAEKFNCRKSAFVDVKMNISLFKIGRAGFPNLRFGV